MTGDGRYKGSKCTDLDECNMYDKDGNKIEMCKQSETYCYNFDYIKTSADAITTKDYGLMYRTVLVPCLKINTS